MRPPRSHFPRQTHIFFIDKFKLGPQRNSGSGLGQGVWDNVIFKILGQAIDAKPHTVNRMSARTSGPYKVCCPVIWLAVSREFV